MRRSSEKGQAMVETAVFSLLAVLLGFALLALIPLHRVRTAATAAAYACAQFVSQSADPIQAVDQAKAVGERTLDAYWSGTPGGQYEIQAWSTGGAGGQGGCTVFFRSQLMFNGLLKLNQPHWNRVDFMSRTETWKARWP